MLGVKIGEKMTRTTALALVIALVQLFPTADTAAARRSSATSKAKTIEFEGKLQNAKRRPIAGVFPLKFSLYRGPKGGRSVWSESHFVAVENGRYTIVLGEKRTLRKRLELSNLYLGVSLVGGAELQRERIAAGVVEDVPGGVDAMLPDKPTTSKTHAQMVTISNGRTTVDYAEEAGMATFAHTADVAKQIGKLDEKELLKRLEARSGGKVTIGTKIRYSASAGGEGGSGYDIRCPKGTVATGVRGTAGIYLDSIQLICSPIE